MKTIEIPAKRVKIGKAIGSLPANVQAVLSEYFNDTSIDMGYISPANVQKMLKGTGLTLPQLMCNLVPIAQAFAFPPISQFQVGAVLYGTSGALYFGANVEFVNEALSFCMHAEQSAITHAINYGETGASYLAVSAAPCGYCRQFLYEITNSKTTPDITVLISPDPTKPYTTAMLSSLLPLAFGPQDLGITARLMQPQNNKLQMSPPPTDQMIIAALKAANYSYSPYTSDFSGICIRTSTKMYVGSYAENAAYNPSVSPLEAALTMLLMNQDSFEDINRAVLVEANGSLCSQFAATTDVLETIAPAITLEYYQATVQE